MVYIFPSPRTILIWTNTSFKGKLYIVEQVKINCSILTELIRG